MPRPIHFELAADDPDRAVAFYSKVFGWKVDKWGGPQDYWLLTTGPDNEPGINGAIMRRQSPEHTLVNTISVPSLDDALASITANGGKILSERMTVPGVGYMAYCQDTEGNPLGVMQMDQTAG